MSDKQRIQDVWHIAGNAGTAAFHPVIKRL